MSLTVEAKRKGTQKNSSEEKTMESRLLDCALTLFSEHGYAATSVRDIIRAAGVTQPTLYYHFRDKAAIFQALIQQHYAESQSRLREIVQSIPDCTSRLRAMLVRSFAFCCNDPRIPRLMFQTYFGPRIPEIDGVLDKLTDERFRLVKQIMQQGIESHELRPSDPQLLALSFCCLMDQPINLFSRRAKPSRFLSEELASALLDQFLHGAGAK